MRRKLSITYELLAGACIVILPRQLVLSPFHHCTFRTFCLRKRHFTQKEEIAGSTRTLS